MEFNLHDFQSFQNRLKLLESLGDGTETFTEEIDIYGKMKNLEIYGCPSEWGEEIEEAKGKIIYSIELQIDKSGIENIIFDIEKIVLDIQIITGYDNNDYPTKREIEYIVNKTDIKTKVETSINSFPLYLNTLEIDFSQAENLDGDFLPEKVKFQLEIGKN